MLEIIKAQAEQIGERIIELFGLTTDKRGSGRYDTAYGTKTPEGIGRTVQATTKEG